MQQRPGSRKSEGTPPAPEAFEDSAYAWGVVGLLTVCYALSFVDRQVLSLLVKPIKADLGLSDTQFSILHGLAFAVFYTFFGIFIGALADRRKRTIIISIGVAAWSLMTMVCGLTKNFVQLFAARAGVAVGEASLSPAAYSLIGDYFPPTRRGRAMSVYSTGLYLGGGLAFIIGGFLLTLIPPQATFGPITLKDWQMVLICVGAPGLPLALLLAFVREPPRGRYAEPGEIAVPRKGEESWRALRSGWQRFALHNFGFSFQTLVGFAFHAWIPAFFIRTHDWSAAQIGMTYGLISIVFAPLGVIAGGVICDHLASRGVRDVYLRGSIFATLVWILPATTATLVPTAGLSLMILACAQLVGGFHTGIAVLALHQMAPLRSRALATAIYLFVVNLVGLGAGPLVVALFTDYIFGDEAAVGLSISATALISLSLSAILLAFLLRRSSASSRPGLKKAAQVDIM